METNKIWEGKELRVEVKGRLDTKTSPEFEKDVAADAQSADRLVLDFSGVEYISSAGLRTIITLFKLMSARGGLTIVGVIDPVWEVFEATGMTDLISISR